MEEIEKDVNNNNNNNANIGVYSPMMTIRKDQEAKMREDNFVITNIQADPDYEAIHFNKFRKLGKVDGDDDEGEIGLEGLEDLNIENFDQLETSSVLNFSSEKRDLVLGIIRKPEIKPLTVFNKDLAAVPERKDNSLEIEVDVNVEDIQALTPSTGEVLEGHEGSEDDKEFSAECPTISNNPFLKNNANMNTKARTCYIDKKLPIKKPVRRLTPSNRSNSPGTHQDIVPGSKAAALIRQFNNEETSHNTELCPSETLKTTTKKLISKFNKETKPTFPRSNYLTNPSLGVRRNTGTKKTASKVQQMVSAFNKSKFLENNIDD